MTQKELGFMEELIKAETLCVRKLEAARHEARDPELRQLMEDGIRAGRQDTETLLRELRA